MKERILQGLQTAIQSLQQQGLIPSDNQFIVQIERARDSKHGDYASNIAMILAKTLKQNPLKLAEEIIKVCPKISGVGNITVAAPGFINITLSDQAYHGVAQEILLKGRDYGRSDLGKNQRIHIEVVSANPTGPLHVGHGRIAAYSASLANVLEAGGYQVHREYYVNDAGRQMRILAVSVWLRYLELLGEKIRIPLSGYKGSYVTAIAQKLLNIHNDKFFRKFSEATAHLPEDNEEQKEAYVDALIQRAQDLLGNDFELVFQVGLTSMVDDIRDDLLGFGVECQEWFFESQLNHTGDIERGLEALKKADYLYERDGAVWFRSSELGDEKDRVVIRENGQPTYFASDIGYHLNKYERGFQHLFDVYGADHHGYAPRLRALVTALGRDPENLYVLLVQFAILWRGKTKVSMSTRAGEFVTLRELREEVGNDAARFFYIMRRRDQHLDFDLELAKSTSNDNPVYYIQYAHARICSMIHQHEQRFGDVNRTLKLESFAILTEPQEKDLLRVLSCFPEVIEQAVKTYEPSVIAHYLLELANGFHSYYGAQQILVEDKTLRSARMCLVLATKQVLENGLKLLGLSAPEYM
jgi:arginyl-tRNA synthetase